jgi:hypothetical protein
MTNVMSDHEAGPRLGGRDVLPEAEDGTEHVNVV